MVTRVFFLLSLLAVGLLALVQVQSAPPSSVPPIQQDPWPSGEQLLGVVGLLALLLLLGCAWPGRRRTFRRSSRR